ncbi:MFS transporter [Jiangella rhizosphaerae]|uniref:MFS transporter n=1 Tax=Jiangella rhizosphaerae TaxID=2293569 RepID=A0A418KWP6_9ACTN|nr:MFS transporter [Jiangella rhizosphaerae]RIQ36736.1 MFS transporter [Jiangella rhizosphaerae]
MTTTDAPARQGLGRNYWKLWSASVVSNFGDGLSAVAIPWLATAVTRDPLQIALVTLATRLPWLLFSLPAGVITDRLDRRKLVAAMDVLRFAVMGTFAFAVLAWQSGLPTPDQIAGGTADLPENGTVLLVLLYLMAFLLGSAEVLRDNTAQTLLPSIVAKDRLEKANGRMWGAEVVVNNFIGPPLAGLLLGLAFALPFFINAGTFAVAAGLVFMLAGQFAPKGKVTSGRIAWKSEIGEGVRWLWDHRLLRSLAFLLGATNGLANAAAAIYVLFAQEILDVDATQFGILLTGAAVGAVLGSLVAHRISARIGPGTSLFLSLATLGGGLAVIGLVSSPIVVYAVFVVEGFFVVLWNVITVSLRQSIIPDHLLGRVNSVYRFFGWGAISVGTLLGGAMVTIADTWLSREWSLRLPYLVAAGVHVLLLVYALPRLTNARIAEAKNQASNADDSVDS